MLVARHYLVGGRVQGVGFRFFARDVAAREGLHGSVQNLPDGRLAIHVEGDAESVERFEWAIRQGPPGARVDDVQTEQTEPTGRATGFRVRG